MRAMVILVKVVRLMLMLVVVVGVVMVEGWLLWPLSRALRCFLRLPGYLHFLSYY